MLHGKAHLSVGDHGTSKPQFHDTEIDTAASLVAGIDDELSPDEDEKIRRKIDLHLMPLMCILYWIQFMDKTTIASSAILGIMQSTHLSTNQFNWLGTIFYLSYLAFQYPQNLALQRFPVSKWMSINVTIWTIALLCHVVCKDFRSLLVVRFILGACEGSITAGFLIVSSMFYTRNEQTVRVGLWFMMDGAAEIITGFISFGVLHTKTDGFRPWQWLMVITGSLTICTAAALWCFFPDSPVNAWFLTKEERAKAVLRIKKNQTGVENKTFKKEQAIEALVDPKTWAFAAFSVFHNVPTSLTIQRTIIVSSMGFTALQTTLLGCISGLVVIISVIVGISVASRIPNSRATVGAASYIPSVSGVFLISLLPWSNKAGLLASVYLTGFSTVGYVLSLSWLTSVTCGHTKRVTTNAIILIAYCVGNAVGPTMWLAKFKPRNRIPWIVIGVCYVACMIVLLLIRFILARENTLRNREARTHTFDDVLVFQKKTNGEIVQVKVDKEFLDLTDRQNRDFRYVL